MVWDIFQELLLFHASTLFLELYYRICYPLFLEQENISEAFNYSENLQILLTFSLK